MQIEVLEPRTGHRKVFWWDETESVARCARHAYIAFYKKQPRGDVPFLRNSLGEVLVADRALGKAIDDPQMLLELGCTGTVV